MKNKRSINLFFLLIAFTIGLTLYKHIDFKNFRLQEPALDILYIFVFAVCIYLVIKDFLRRER